jgi:hypothetical protein
VASAGARASSQLKKNAVPSILEWIADERGLNKSEKGPKSEKVRKGVDAQKNEVKAGGMSECITQVQSERNKNRKWGNLLPTERL